jgi:hypothetical protein
LEVASLKSLTERLSELEAEASRLTAENTQVAMLEAEIARLIAGGSAGPVAASGQPMVVIPPGTLLAENAHGMQALRIELKAAELIIAKGRGRWDFSEFEAKVVGRAPVLVLIEYADGVCGGVAAVPFQSSSVEYSTDPAGASFVFSLQPPARYPLKVRENALDWGSHGRGVNYLSFCRCLRIYDDGRMERWGSTPIRSKHTAGVKWCDTYAVPFDWATSGRELFTRFEIWSIAL